MPMGTNKTRDNINDEDNIFGYMELGANKKGGPNVFMRGRST